MHINIIPRWDYANEQGQRLHADLLPLLEKIQSLGTLSAAAKACKLSYRHAWNLLEKSAAFFGQPLVLLEKGRGARLTPLGDKFLGSHRRIEARLQPELEAFATELNASLQSELSSHRPLVRIYASHGYAVALMTQFPRYSQVEIHYHAPRHALAALNEGRCRIAGFHLPLGFEIPGQRAAYEPLLDPQRFGIIHFIRRQQGLMFARDNPFGIQSIADLNQPGLRFINRQDTSGTRELFEYLLRRAQIDSGEIAGFHNQEFTHSAVAAHIASSTADAGFGVEAAARRFDLGFCPIVEERYMWAYPLEAENDADIQAFQATLTDPEFQAQINQLPGYACDRSGETGSAATVFS